MSRPLRCSKLHHERFRRYGLLLFIFLVAVIVRLPNLLSEPLWYDEAVSEQLSSGNAAQVITASAHDSTPPLFFLGLAGWRTLFGHSDPTFRSYPLTWSLIGMVVLFAWARRAGGWKLGCIAALLLAINPIDAYFATEVRMYSQGAALGTLSAWLLWEWLRAMEKMTSQHRIILGASYAAAAAALVMTHYVGVVLLLVEALWVASVTLRARQWLRLAEYASWSAAGAVVFSLWYVYLISVQGGFNTANFLWMTHPPLPYFVNFLWHEFFWGRNPGAQSSWWGISLALVAAGALGVVAFYRRGGNACAHVAYAATLLLLAPVSAGLLGCLYQPMYNRERFAVFLAPLFSLIIGSLASGGYVQRMVTAFVAGTLAIGTMLQQQTVRRCDWAGFGFICREEPRDLYVFFPPRNAVAAQRYAHVEGKTLNSAELSNPDSELSGKKVLAVVEDGIWLTEPGLRAQYNQLCSLGSPIEAGKLAGLTLMDIRAGQDVPPEFADRFRLWCGPEDRPGFVTGFEQSGAFHAPETGSDGRKVRWSSGTAILSITGDESPSTATLAFEWPPHSSGCTARFYCGREVDEQELFATLRPLVWTSPGHPGPQQIEIAIPNGKGPILIGWNSDTINLKQKGVSDDSRELGLLVHWVGVRK